MPSVADSWLHRFAVCTASATGILIFVGGLVTSTGSGLSVPDWPLSFGQVFPPMVGGVLYEHGHRMVATFVGLMTVVLAVWIWVAESRRQPRRLAALALGTVITQGVLGGVTVLLELPLAVSVAHACLGQVFLCVTVALAVVTNPGWHSGRLAGVPKGGFALPALSVALVGAVFVQLVLGAGVRHMGAGLAIPDFPLAFGGLVPPAFPPPVLIHFLHRVGAVVVSGVVIAVYLTVRRHFGDAAALRQPADWLAALVAGQLVLGALTIWSWRAVLPTTAHVAVGAAILATAVTLAMRAGRLVKATESQGVQAAVVADRVPA